MNGHFVTNTIILLTCLILLSIPSSNAGYFSRNSKPQLPPSHFAFGCSFHDPNYNLLNITWKNQWPVDPIYGNERVGTLRFEGSESFGKFYDKVETIRKHLFDSGKYVYNTLEPFNKFYTAFKASKSKSLSKFYKSYRPEFPPLNVSPLPAGNKWNGLIWIYEELVKYNIRVAEHFTIATGDQDLTEDEVNEMVTNDQRTPPLNFQHDSVIGVIRFSIASKYIGYLIIDLGNIVTPCPIVMENDQHPLHKKSRAKSAIFESSVKYSLRGPRDLPTYIQMEVVASTPESSHQNLFYIRKSLCSFASIEKAALLNPVREVSLYNGAGQLSAFLWVNVTKPLERTQFPAPNMILSVATGGTLKNTYEQLDRFQNNLMFSHKPLNEVLGKCKYDLSVVYDYLINMKDIENSKYFQKELTNLYKTIVHAPSDRVQFEIVQKRLKIKSGTKL